MHPSHSPNPEAAARSRAGLPAPPGAQEPPAWQSQPTTRRPNTLALARLSLRPAVPPDGRVWTRVTGAERTGPTEARPLGRWGSDLRTRSGRFRLARCKGTQKWAPFHPTYPRDRGPLTRPSGTGTVDPQLTPPRLRQVPAHLGRPWDPLVSRSVSLPLT